MTTEPKPTQPFEDISNLIASMPAINQAAYDDVAEQLTDYMTDLAPFGRTAEALKWLAGWQGRWAEGEAEGGRADPSVERPLIAVFAGSHGFAQDVMAHNPADAAKARIAGLTKGRAAIRGIAGTFGAAFKVYEMGIEYPSDDMTKQPSLSERDCAAAIAFGMEVVAEGADLIVLGNAGFGSATCAAAIAHGLFGGSARYWAGGRGDMAKARIAAVKAAVEQHRALLSNPLDVLRCFGGRDIAGMVGAIMAARHQSIPIILDGYIACAAAAVLHEIAPDSIAHCYAGHQSSEPAHGALLDRLGLKPLLDLGIGVGDGTGGAMAMGVLAAAANGLRTAKSDNVGP